MPSDTEIVRVLPLRWKGLNWHPDVKIRREGGDILLFWDNINPALAFQTHIHLFHDAKKGGWGYNIKCNDRGAERHRHSVNPAWSVDQLITQMTMDWFYECREFFDWLKITDMKIHKILAANQLPLSYMYYSPIAHKHPHPHLTPFILH